MNNKRKCISCSVNDPTEFVLTRFALGVMKHLGGKNKCRAMLKKK